LNKILNFWRGIRYSLWFIPASIVGFALLLSLGAIEADATISSDLLARWPRIFGASADGARSVLQVVASAMITVAGLTFSITILVLSLGASQYTPRIIRTFMGNRPTQIVLGVFVGIFVYCLIVLRSIRGGEEAFIPSIAVTIAILLALVGVGFLVYFIHHVASSIQASAIASSVAEDTIRMIDVVYPDLLKDDPEGTGYLPSHETLDVSWYPLGAAKTGYIQTVNIDVLISYAQQHSVVVRMDKPIGAFVIQGLPIASITAPPHKDAIDQLCEAYSINHYRTVDKDIGVGIRQLVDIALRAMSPAMNDTTTAILCIDFLTAIMVKLATRRIVPNHCYHNGALKVITTGTSFEKFLHEAYEQIRENAQTSTAIYLRLLHVLETLSGVTKDPSRRKQIASQVQHIASYARRNLPTADQLERVEKAHLQAISALQA
jgi:uncharacterized membrane protein